MEKETKPISGYLGLLIILAVISLSILGIIYYSIYWLSIIIAIALFCVTGLLIVNPNESSVLVLFGKYKGSVRTNGFYWTNPFFNKRNISLRARSMDSEPIKVNDKIGNPIMIGIVMVWKVKDTFKASFEVDDFKNFVCIQSDAAIRKLAGSYPYDNFEDEDEKITLRGSGKKINIVLEEQITERLSIAGIEILEARINYIAYASEIAEAMLRRQQAIAIVAARFKIVEGAVSMVQMALEELSEKDIIELDDEQKAAMVSNLMVVLCSDRDANPVINAGTLNK